jgi:outer membrane usher protein FimD/PapC
MEKVTSISLTKSPSFGGVGEAFTRTAQAASLMQQLHINFRAVQNGEREEMKRYAYCIAAGAAQAANINFDFTIEQFILACPPDWRERVDELINTPQPPEGGALHAANLEGNDQSTESVKAEKAKSNEAPKAAKASERAKKETIN